MQCSRKSLYKAVEGSSTGLFFCPPDDRWFILQSKRCLAVFEPDKIKFNYPLIIFSLYTNTSLEII